MLGAEIFDLNSRSLMNLLNRPIEAGKHVKTYDTLALMTFKN